MNAAAVTSQPTTRADDALLAAIRQGDALAFEEIFNRYYPKVYAVALRVLGSPEDDEELTLDVFMKLHQRPVAQTGDGALGGWLYRTTLNAAFNATRSRKRRRSWLDRFSVLQRGERISGTNPADLVMQASEIQVVRKALARLPEKQRNALVLRSHGFQYREIAAILEMKETAVGTTLARGERALRRELEGEVRA
jgi:RNA polymerase sigma-70 factor (ECF subfamily)